MMIQRINVIINLYAMVSHYTIFGLLQQQKSILLQETKSLLQPESMTRATNATLNFDNNVIKASNIVTVLGLKATFFSHYNRSNSVVSGCIRMYQ